jgi:hypothetical protein
MNQATFYVGYEQAEERADRERALGYSRHCLDPGVSPSDYHDWGVTGQDVLVFDLIGASGDYLINLRSALQREGAASILILDTEGKGLYRSAPLEQVEEAQAA